MVAGTQNVPLINKYVMNLKFDQNGRNSTVKCLVATLDLKIFNFTKIVSRQIP